MADQEGREKKEGKKFKEVMPHTKQSYEIHIGEITILPEGKKKPKQIVYISEEQREALVHFANVEKDEDLNEIFVINNVRFRILLRLDQKEKS